MGCNERCAAYDLDRVKWLLILAVSLGAVFLLFIWLNHKTKAVHAAFARDDVIAAIENVLGPDMHDEWDLFLAWPIDDPYLESVRQRCIAIDAAHSGTERGKDIGSEGEKRLREILVELRSGTGDPK